MGGAKAILATVTDGKAMESIAGGLGPNSVTMVIGDVGPLPSIPPICSASAPRSKAGIRGIARDSEDTVDFSRRNKIASMNEIYPLENAQDAYDRMLGGNTRFRVMLNIAG